MTGLLALPVGVRTLLLIVALAVAGVVLSSCRSASVPVGVESAADRATPLRLDAAVLRSQIVARDSALFADLALGSFHVLAPGGLVEDKRRAIAGIAAWDATDLEVSGAEVVLHGPVSLGTARLDIDGEMRPVGRWGALKTLSTWGREGGRWRLLSRSRTPCLGRLVEMGRC